MTKKESLSAVRILSIWAEMSIRAEFSQLVFVQRMLSRELIMSSARNLKRSFMKRRSWNSKRGMSATRFKALRKKRK